MAKRPELTPCIICEKAVIYLWPENQNATNLSSAANVSIQAFYGSDHDTAEFAGIVCDTCLDRLVQNKRLRFIQYHNPL